MDAYEHAIEAAKNGLQAAIAIQREEANEYEAATNTAVSNLGDLYAIADKRSARADALQRVYDLLLESTAD